MTYGANCRREGDVVLCNDLRNCLAVYWLFFREAIKLKYQRLNDGIEPDFYLWCNNTI